MIMYFTFILAYLLIIYSTVVAIVASSLIIAVRDVANRTYWEDDDYHKIKIAKRFLYSLIITIPVAVVLTKIANQYAKNHPTDMTHDYNIRLDDVPAQYNPKIILSDKDTGETVEEIKI